MSFLAAALLAALPQVETHHLDSESLDERREFRVAVPQGYGDTSLEYPVRRSSSRSL